jgi:hypothetical protein
MSPSPILHTLPSGGSGQGLTYWTDEAICPRRAWLNKNEGSRGLPHDKALQAGVIYHALQDLYRRFPEPGFDTVRVEYVQDSGDREDVDEAARLEAERLFREYRTRFKPTDLGHVTSVEKFYDVSNIELPWKPYGMPLTCRVDLETKIGATAQQRIRIARGVNVPLGNYIVDFKTDAYRTPVTRERYLAEIQFPLYMLIRNAVEKKRPPVVGALIDVAFKTKSPDFDLIYIPPPSKDTTEIVSAFLWHAWKIFQQEAQEAQNGDIPRTNPRACYSWNRPCPWLVAERCNRR